MTQKQMYVDCFWIRGSIVFEYSDCVVVVSEFMVIVFEE